MRLMIPILLITSAGDVWPAAAEDRTVQTITVESMWGAILEQAETELVFDRQGEQLFLNRHPVDPWKIRSLVAALSMPPVTRDRAFTARVPQLWLDRHASFVANQRMGRADTPERAKFEALFRDRSYMARIFDELFDTVTLDDNTWVKVHIRFADGEVWTAESSSNHLFMLPWKVHRGDMVAETFDLNIAKAVGLLLPDKAVNRWRLLGEDVPEKLGRQVGRN